MFVDDAGYGNDYLNASRPTHVTETDWYAPALGRSVRSENRAEWMVTGLRYPWVSGDWNVYELVSLPASMLICFSSTVTP